MKKTIDDKFRYERKKTIFLTVNTISLVINIITNRKKGSMSV